MPDKAHITEAKKLVTDLLPDNKEIMGIGSSQAATAATIILMATILFQNNHMTTSKANSPPIYHLI
jgi:hypothetical protein